MPTDKHPRRPHRLVRVKREDGPAVDHIARDVVRVGSLMLDLLSSPDPLALVKDRLKKGQKP